MSTENREKPQVVELGKHKIPTRITVKRLRRLKEQTGLDLTSQETGPMLEFAVDPLVVTEVCNSLYRDHLDAAGIDEDAFEELCGPEEIEALRQEVTQQMKSFSRFWRILSTAMEDLQSGNTDQLEKQMALAKAAQGVEASGPSS